MSTMKYNKTFLEHAYYLTYYTHDGVLLGQFTRFREHFSFFTLLNNHFMKL